MRVRNRKTEKRETGNGKGMDGATGQKGRGACGCLHQMSMLWSPKQRLKSLLLFLCLSSGWMAEAEAADATGLEGAGSEICYYEKKHDRKMVRSGMIGTCEGVTYTSEDAGFLGGEEDPCWDAYCGEEQIRLLNEPFRDCKYLEPGEKAAVFSLSVFEKTKEAFYLVLYTENYVILEDGQEPVSVNTFLLRMENDGSTEVLDARFSS